MSVSEADIIDHCRTRLATPKLPKQVLIVAELPKSDRGKVLRDKLREDWSARTKLSA
jgi:acyl-CoA synthetase (AMP-forming)/AMP-acid ligase II